MQNPGKPGCGFHRVRILSLGSDTLTIPEAGTPYQARAVLRLQRGAEHLHRLGPRAVAEFIGAIGNDHRCLPDMLDLLDQWRERLSPEMLRGGGGDRFPRRALVGVPR